MYTAIKLDPGLQIELVNGRTTYRARAYADGRTGYFSTRTSERADAEKIAREWFATWKNANGLNADPHTMSRAATLTGNLYRPAEARAKEDFYKRWNAIRDVCRLGRMPVSQVTAKFLRSFAIARGDIAGSTAKKDWDTIRPILRTAMDEGWIDRLPTFPKVVITKNPRVPFSLREYRVLLAHADIESRDFMEMVVLGLFRPHEVLRITKADVVERGERMGIHIRRKTGIAHAPVPMRFPVLREAIRRRMAEAGEDGRLFPHPEEWFPRRFRAILEETGLRQPPGGHLAPRDSWSLRATGICLEIRRQRKRKGAADLLQIARWAGTSVGRIDGHYAAFLA